jgi:hypothetical protein
MGRVARIDKTREVIERSMPLFPARFKTHLRYCDSLSLSTGAGIAGNYVYSANGLFDPDITGTGHQPMGFDQVMLSYEHYCVTRATMTLNVRHTATAQSGNVAILLTSGATPSTDYQRNLENGILVRERFNATPYEGSLGNLVATLDVARFGSVPKLLDNPDYKGTIAANPVEQSYFHISVWNADNANVGTFSVDVMIDYESWFFEPRDLTQSFASQIKSLVLTEMKVRPERRT